MSNAREKRLNTLSSRVISSHLMSSHVKHDAAELDRAPLVHGVRHLEHHHQEKRDDRRCKTSKYKNPQGMNKKMRVGKLVNEWWRAFFERGPHREDPRAIRDAGLTFRTRALYKHQHSVQPTCAQANIARTAVTDKGGQRKWAPLQSSLESNCQQPLPGSCPKALSLPLSLSLSVCACLSLSLSVSLTACCPSDLDESRIIRQHVAQGKDGVLVR